MDDDNFPLPETEINEKLINSFIKKTSSSREEANSFLETHQWNLDAAVSAFTANNVAAARSRYSNLRISTPVHSSDYYTPSPSGLLLRPPSQCDRNPFSKKRAADNQCQSRRIKRRELAGNKPTVAGGSDDSDSDDYDGGEPSGTMMEQDPEKGEDVDDKDKESDVQSSPRTTFRIISAVTIWRNGFTVDDGPLHTLGNPEDATFINVVQRMESPRDISLRIKLIKRQEEDFNESTEPNTLTPFQGVGRTLSGSDSTATEPPVSSGSLTTTPPPSTSLVVDPAAPVTSIQVILADGTRIFSRFNTHHTIRDVRGFIDASRPGGSNDYWLLMGFPPKPLLDFDLDQTIEKAGISNSVLILKY